MRDGDDRTEFVADALDLDQVVGPKDPVPTRLAATDHIRPSDG
jgi:hypothetical protein